MSSFTNFYYAEKLILYGMQKTKSDDYDTAIKYCINSGFLDQRGQATEAGKNLIKFVHHLLLVEEKEVA